MPTVFSHTAVPIALGLGLGKKIVSPRLMAAGIAASVLPDVDGISFWTGISYASVFGHRGLTHSLLFVLLCALLGAAFHRLLKTKALTAFLFIGTVVISHILLDSLTNGGLGTALWWPFSPERFFFGTRPIEVSPVTLQRLLSARGIKVFISELQWVWLPSLALFLLASATRLFFKTKRT